MNLAKLTKKELLEKLIKMQEISLYSFNRKKRSYILAKGFLEDFNKFSKVLSTFPDSQSFNVIHQSSKIYNKKTQLNILFDSFSILLLQDDDQLYIYCIAEYKLK